MTYCVGLLLERGLVFMSDTRTNASVDNISSYKKMFTWSRPGELCLTLMTAGNLATTQAVVSLLDEREKEPGARQPNILEVKTMFEAATMIGATLKEVIATHSDNGQGADSTFQATMILGGQIGAGAPRLFLIYPEGNFIEASCDTPFFQIGEVKYGRPILLRAFDPAMSFEEAIKLLVVSFDSTIKANLSVSPPLDVHVYRAGSLRPGPTFRLKQDDPYLETISTGWGVALRKAFGDLPPFEMPAEA
ncbi:peptidase [Tropicimonas sp. IMCC6043]|uniref:peptidase n=1 Tax=Tropicimonas sp. IMCC6043 TaxID=2510645 RepID=UPI00101DE595|nr:peptidase [Tropicimonas sp. IMCC6043]RYH11152.1 peptidase [Tropicimonas sp. IMCC6043]